METATTDMYRIEPHGVDGEQYFQGAGTAFTPFSEVMTGIGDTEAEAYEDAVEQIAYGYDDALVDALELPKFWGDDEHDVCEGCRSRGAMEHYELDCELHYYVSVYFNVE